MSAPIEAANVGLDAKRLAAVEVLRAKTNTGAPFDERALEGLTLEPRDRLAVLAFGRARAKHVSANDTKKVQRVDQVLEDWSRSGRWRERATPEDDGGELPRSLGAIGDALATGLFAGLFTLDDWGIVRSMSVRA